MQPSPQTNPSDRKIAETVLDNSYPTAITSVLDQLNAPALLSEQPCILIKPNLITNSEPPITTPVDCIAALTSYIRTNIPDSHIIVAEGCGTPELETDTVFEDLGYVAWAEKEGIELVDLNHAPTVKLQNDNCQVFPEFHIPAIALESFIVSVPVLKAHTLAGVTLSIKNMLGLPPPAFYNAGSWKKSAFHARIQESILDLSRYRRPDLTLIDASIGMPDGHLSGRTCEPPINRIIASVDPVAADKRGCELLGIDWRKIRHIAEAE